MSIMPRKWLPPKTTTCPACLFMLREYGASDYERDTRMDPRGAAWCGHHRRASNQLRDAWGVTTTFALLEAMERFAGRFQTNGESHGSD